MLQIKDPIFYFEIAIRLGISSRAEPLCKNTWERQHVWSFFSFLYSLSNANIETEPYIWERQHNVQNWKFNYCQFMLCWRWHKISFIQNTWTQYRGQCLQYANTYNYWTNLAQMPYSIQFVGDSCTNKTQTGNSVSDFHCWKSKTPLYEGFMWFLLSIFDDFNQSELVPIIVNVNWH